MEVARVGTQHRLADRVMSAHGRLLDEVDFCYTQNESAPRYCERGSDEHGRQLSQTINVSGAEAIASLGIEAFGGSMVTANNRPTKSRRDCLHLSPRTSGFAATRRHITLELSDAMLDPAGRDSFLSRPEPEIYANAACPILSERILPALLL